MSEKYDASDEALRRPVDADELTALIDSGARGLNPTRTLHLLRRTRATLAAASQTIAGLHRHIASLQEHSRRSGAATTLNPVDALRFLDDEQKERIFGQLARNQLNTLRTLVDRAQATHDRVNTELESLRGIATSLMQRPDIPPHARAEIAHLIASLPTAASDVYRPPMLDFPDPDATQFGASSPAPYQPTTQPAPASPPAPMQPAPVYADPHAPTTAAPAYVDPYAPPQPAPAFVDPYAPTQPTSFADVWATPNDPQPRHTA